MNRVLDGVQIPPRAGAIFRGNDSIMSGNARRHSAMSCAKMAEPIEVLFGLRTQVGRRKHVLTLAPPGKYN